jgi:hypothetical protein
MPAIIGRAGTKPLFLRPTPQTWNKPEREPWLSSAQLDAPWAKIMKRAGLAETVVPYALRHSSIVRGLSAGLPVRRSRRCMT